MFYFQFLLLLIFIIAHKNVIETIINFFGSREVLQEKIQSRDGMWGLLLWSGAPNIFFNKGRYLKRDFRVADWNLQKTMSKWLWGTVIVVRVFCDIVELLSQRNLDF